MKKGYNIHTADNGLIEHLRKAKPPVVLVLENYGLAHDIAVQFPAMKVIYRPYYGQSDAYHLIMSPADYVARQRAKWQGEPNIWFHTGNESGLSIEQQTWEMNVVNLAPTMKFVVGSPATGTFPDSADKWAYADKYIRFLVDNKDRVMLGLHEYFDIVPCVTMPNFTNRIQSWDGPTRPGWHTNRFMWLIDYCDSQHIGYPNIVLTECGNDDLRENRDNSDVNALIDSVHVTAPYHNIRGWKSLREQWETWYKRPADITYFKMLDWLERNVYNHPAIVGMCIFAWCSPSSEWDVFNVAYADNFRRLMEEQSTMTDKMMTVAYNVRFRSAPAVASTTLKQFVAGKYLVSVSDGDVTAKDGYHWQKIVSDGIEGYVATEVVTFEPVPPPVVNPDVLINGLTLDDAKSMLVEVMGNLDGIKSDVNAVLIKLQTARGA